MKKVLLSLLATVALSGPASANLVDNGSFETGDFSGWTLSGNTDPNSVGVLGSYDGFNPTDGAYQAAFGPIGESGSISQNLTTTAGGVYTLSFDLALETGTPNAYSVTVNGNVLDSLTDSPPFDYSRRSFNFTASSASTALTFTFRDDPQFYFLDNVVVDAANVPEPAMLGLVGLGAIALSLNRRRKA